MPKKGSNGGFAPKKPSKNTDLWVSQNFLTSAAAIRRLLRHTDLRPGDFVIEIGPGKGHITRQLLAMGARVLAAELDPRLCDRLEKDFGDHPNFTLYRGDFFTLPLPKAGAYKVVSNIPFSRTTDILRRLTQAANPPGSAWLLMEKGAAMRFCGRPVESTASLVIKPFFAVRIAAHVPRTEFHPTPKVDAALLCLQKRDEPHLPVTEQAAFGRFVKTCREKGVRSLLTKRQIAAALRACPDPAARDPLTVRDGNMLYVQWLCLFRAWQQYAAKS